MLLYTYFFFTSFFAFATEKCKSPIKCKTQVHNCDNQDQTQSGRCLKTARVADDTIRTRVLGKGESDAFLLRKTESQLTVYNTPRRT